jgi:outer membrane immunogenic protein
MHRLALVVIGAVVFALAAEASAQSQPLARSEPEAPALEPPVPSSSPKRPIVRGDASEPMVAGAALVFGTEPATLGLQGNAFVPVPLLKGLRVGGDFVFYLPFSQSNVDLFWFSLNPGAQFVFDLGVPLHPYIEAGLAIAIIHESLKGGGATNTDTELGLNLGGGAEYDLSFARAFGALRFQFVGDSRDQAEFIGGLRWAL